VRLHQFWWSARRCFPQGRPACRWLGPRLLSRRAGCLRANSRYPITSIKPNHHVTVSAKSIIALEETWIVNTLALTSARPYPLALAPRLQRASWWRQRARSLIIYPERWLSFILSVTTTPPSTQL
jgi:hypothetical protein